MMSINTPPLSASRAASRGKYVTHAVVHAAAALLPTPLDRESSECRHERGTIPSGTSLAPRTFRRAGDGGRESGGVAKSNRQSHWERLWRHKPSALPNRMAEHAGGARTRACRVATLGDASGFPAARGSDTSVAAARKSACATSVPRCFQQLAGRFVASAHDIAKVTP